MRHCGGVLEARVNLNARRSRVLMGGPHAPAAQTAALMEAIRREAVGHRRQHPRDVRGVEALFAGLARQVRARVHPHRHGKRANLLSAIIGMAGTCFYGGRQTLTDTDVLTAVRNYSM